MTECCQRPWFQLPRFTAVLFLYLFVTGAIAATDEAAKDPALADLSVAKQLEQHGGEFSDLFAKLKESSDFARLSKKHGLDDPAVWPTMHERFVLNLADLRGKLSEAESMASARDKRSGLNNQVISAEETRKKGRMLKEEVTQQINELRHMLRLIDEMRAALEVVSRDHALTGEITIENKNGQSLQGQALLVDGDDLIVKHGEASYFRVPANRLSNATKLKVMEGLVAAWDALPLFGGDETGAGAEAEAEAGVEVEAEAENVAEAEKGAEVEAEAGIEVEADADTIKGSEGAQLIAYDKTHSYLKDTAGDFQLQKQKDAELDFIPYEQQLATAQEVVEAASSAKDEKESAAEFVKQLQAARALNQSRLETIAWYGDRLGLQLPVSVTG